MEKITLAQGKWLVELMPQAGGSISSCAYDGQDIMRRASAEGVTAGDARAMACFPLVPFSNRIERGIFDFDGRCITLPRNMGDHPHTIHGHGWLVPWQVEARGEDSATLAFTHEADAWPWRYRAQQDFTLAEDSLTVRLAVANLSDRPMPVGLGLHPYFPRGAGVTLTAGLTHLWEATSEQIPIRRVDLPGSLDFARGLPIAGLDLDHCFAGWSRQALIEWEGAPWRLRMEGDGNLGHLVIYTPRDQDFFCAEGVENMNNAFNWMARRADTGARILAPGESHAIVTTFKVEPAA